MGSDMCRDELRPRRFVVVDKEENLPGGAAGAEIPARRRPGALPLDDDELVAGLERGEHLVRSVRRAIHHHDHLVLAGLRRLPVERLEAESEKLPPVVRRDHHAQVWRGPPGGFRDAA
jgi:hypothetical protein